MVQVGLGGGLGRLHHASRKHVFSLFVKLGVFPGVNRLFSFRMSETRKKERYSGKHVIHTICNSLQLTAIHCNSLQLTVTYSNTL